MEKKYICPKCQKELKEENAISGVCPYCHAVFEATTIESQQGEVKEIKETVSENKVELNYCPNCGKKIDRNVKFCPFCGSPISIIVDEGKVTQEPVFWKPKPKRSFEKTDEGKKLKNAKILGGIGAILSILAILPVIGWLLSLAGIVLVFIAVKKIADVVERTQIFRDFIKAFICDIIALPISFLVLMPTLLRSLRLLDKGITTGVGRMLSGGAIFAILVFVGLLIGYGYFIRKSFTAITEETGEGNFRTAGNITFISSILMIILVGFIGFIVATIFEIIAFFSLPEELPGKE